MTELATLARPYATAVFKRAKETDSLAGWSDFLGFLSSVVNNQEITSVLDNPKVSPERLSSLMLDICQGQIDAEGGNFLKLLVKNRRLLLASHIATQFEQLKAAFEGYVDVEVFTAFALSKDEQKTFSSTLEKTLNKKVHINVTVDKSLIGGVLVRAGDKVIDGSIKGQLQHMQKTLQ